MIYFLLREYELLDRGRNLEITSSNREEVNSEYAFNANLIFFFEGAGSSTQLEIYSIWLLNTLWLRPVETFGIIYVFFVKF